MLTHLRVGGLQPACTEAAEQHETFCAAVLLECDRPLRTCSPYGRRSDSVPIMRALVGSYALPALNCLSVMVIRSAKNPRMA